MREENSSKGAFCGNEDVLKAEVAGAAFAEGADAIGFGGVVAAEVKVEALFLGEGEVFLAELTGDEGISAGFPENREGAAAGTSEEGDPLRFFGPVLDGGDGFSELFLEAGFQIMAGGRGLDEEGDGCSLVGEEPVNGLEAKDLGEETVVTQFLVGVEGEVGTVEGEVVGEGEAQLFIEGPGVASGRIPHHAVVDYEEIDTLRDGFLERDKAGVDG